MPQSPYTRPSIYLDFSILRLGNVSISDPIVPPYNTTTWKT
jgi:hypothetical protein